MSTAHSPISIGALAALLYNRDRLTTSDAGRLLARDLCGIAGVGMSLGHEIVAGLPVDHGTVADETALLALHNDSSATATPRWVKRGDFARRADRTGYLQLCIAGHGTSVAEWAEVPLTAVIADLVDAINAKADVIAVASALAGKAATTHGHPLSQITQSGAADGQVPTWSDAEGAYIPASPSVSPHVIAATPGLRLWLRNETLASTDSLLLTHWADSSGQANHCSAPSTLPTVRTNVVNGRPVCRFTGSQYLRSGYIVIPSATVVTVFVVACPMSSVWNVLIEQATSAVSLENGTSLNPLGYIGNSGGAAAAASTNGTWEIRMLRTSGSTLINSRNGVDGTPVTFSGDTGTALMTLGGRNGGQSLSTCDVAEVAVFSEALTSEQRSAILAHLAGKFSITLG